MKKFLSLLVSFIFFAGMAKAQYVTIPDSNFRAYLEEQYPSCFNGSGMMDTTCSTIANATRLLIPGMQISDLTGIQYFKSLDTLICELTIITNWSTLPNTLTYFDCSGNGSITGLPNLPPSLVYLNCSTNEISNLPTLPNSLTYLNCGNNGQMDSLPALPNSLTYLICSGDLFLPKLPNLPNSLIYLDCSQIGDPPNYTGFDSLPALPGLLTYLNCSQD